MGVFFWTVFIFGGLFIGYLGLLVLEIMAEDYPREF
jgi:hypothetical protein